MPVVVGLVTLASLIALGETFGYLRAVIGIAMFFGILALGLRRMHKVTQLPPETEVEDVSGYGLKYVCTVCGLELKVEMAAAEKAPSHCMEKMVLVREGGRPPLRPV